MKEFARGFYQSKAWRELRDKYFNSCFGLCERCGRPALIIHHKIYLTADNIGNPNVSLNWDNLECLCLECHNKEHGYFSKSDADRTYIFDGNGNIINVVDRQTDAPHTRTPKSIL
jgi:5-methylcytosine-specific restriction endonuclease McrA